MERLTNTIREKWRTLLVLLLPVVLIPLIVTGAKVKELTF